MKKSLLILPNGYEEIEALTVVDCLRRINLHIDMISITGSLETTGDHNIRVIADFLFEDINLNNYHCLITPGGLSGTNYMLNHKTFLNELKSFYKREDTLIASICASPLILEKIDVAKLHQGTAYPSILPNINYKKASHEFCVDDGKIITASGPAISLIFSYKIIARLKSTEEASSLAETMQYNRLITQKNNTL